MYSTPVAPAPARSRLPPAPGTPICPVEALCYSGGQERGRVSGDDEECERRGAEGRSGGGADQDPPGRRFRGDAQGRAAGRGSAGFHHAACAAGRHHRRARPPVPRLHRRPRRDSGAAQLPRIPALDLHLHQPRRLPRHPRRPQARRGRHRQHRHHRHPRRLARRHQPHVPGRRARALEGAPPGRCHLRGDDARHRGGAAGRAHRRHRPCHPELRRGAALLGGARFLRPRHRPHLPRRAVDPAFRRARGRAGAVTKDRSLSAQFEHTIGVTQDGHEIFTLSPKGWHRPPYA